MFGKKAAHVGTAEHFDMTGDERELWYLAEGVRSKKATEWLNKEGSADTLMVHSLTQRPCETLLFHFFAEQEKQEWKGLSGVCPIRDLASEAFSPASRCLEEYIVLLNLETPYMDHFLSGLLSHTGHTVLSYQLSIIKLS